MKLQLRAAASVLLLACSTGPGDAPAPDPGAAINVLFIGNSLTYANDLPGVLRALSESTGVGPVHVRSVALPDFSLEDHWNEGSALRAVERPGWDVVVMQQGPSALESSRVLLLDYATRFAARIRAAGAVPAMYAVWPSSARFGDFSRVSESYFITADSLNGMLIPAGETWRAVWRHDSTVALYGPDGFHPSQLGTYAAAMTAWRRLTGQSPVGLPRRLRSEGGTDYDIPAALALLIQQSVLETDSISP